MSEGRKVMHTRELVAEVARRTRYRHGQTRQSVRGVLEGLAAVITEQLAEGQAVSVARCGATRGDPTTTGWGMSSSSVIMSPPYSDPLWRSGCIPPPDSRLILVGCVMTSCCAVKPRGDYKRIYRLGIEGGFIHIAYRVRGYRILIKILHRYRLTDSGNICYNATLDNRSSRKKDPSFDLEPMCDPSNKSYKGVPNHV